MFIICRVLRHICGCLQRTVAKQWPDNEIVKPRVVSGFIFLRLLCPALVNPRNYNLVTEPPAEPASRTLKLVAKSLINLANLVEVGTKELYMEAVGPFIVDNKNRMVTFLNELAVSDCIEWAPPGLGKSRSAWGAPLDRGERLLAVGSVACCRE